MLAPILSSISQFPHELGKLFQNILLRTGIFSFLKMNFLRTIALVIVAIVGWTGVSVGNHAIGTVGN